MSHRISSLIAGLSLLFCFSAQATTYVPIAVGDITVIIPLDDPPVVTGDSFTVVEDTPTVLDVLANDSDENLLSSTISIVSYPVNGEIALSSDGRTLTYTPHENSNSADAFTYRLTDENNNVSSDSPVVITIQPVDDVPVFSSRRTENNSSVDAFLNYGTPHIEMTPLASLTDVDDVLDNIHDFRLEPSNAGNVQKLSNTKLRWNIANGFEGFADIHFSVISGGAEYWYELKYAVHNRPNDRPEVFGPSVITAREGDSFSFHFSVFDADGDDMSFSLAGRPSWPGGGTIGYATGGSRAFINSSLHLKGSYPMELWVSDDRLVTKHPFTLVVLGPEENAPPYYKYTPPTHVKQGQNYSYSPTFSDVDGDEISISVSNLPGWLSYDKNTQKISGFAASAGTYNNISITATAGGQVTTIGPFDVTVVSDPVYENNNAPIAFDDSQIIAAGQTHIIDVLQNDYDPDGDSLTVVNASASQGTVQIINGGTQLSYTAPVELGEALELSYVISDGKGGSSSAYITGPLERVYYPKPPAPTGLTASGNGHMVGNTFTVVSGTLINLAWTNPDLSELSSYTIVPKIHTYSEPKSFSGQLQREPSITERYSSATPDNQVNDYMSVFYPHIGDYQIAVKLCHKRETVSKIEICSEPSNHVDINVTSLIISGLGATPSTVSVNNTVLLEWDNVSSLAYFVVEKRKPNGDGSTGNTYEVIETNLSNNQLSVTPDAIGTWVYKVKACITSSLCGAEKEIEVIVNNRRVVFIHTDLLGSPVAETDENGSSL